MASYLTGMDEIHRIIFEAPDSSDDSWQSSSEDSIRSSGRDSSQKMPKQHLAANKKRNFTTSGTSRQLFPAQRQR